ncbi:MAG TPA: prepilin-type N-terminal cleavage/methylation domain-containing protein [Armatimonadota bacterium]|nr:prepilin-type N-terminal cleavage/methylation domain-containing protein [Armatimonadota bacterium]
MLTARRYRTRARRGFTLIEVLIVVMYIAILAAMVIPSVSGAGRRARETNLKATVRELRTAIGSYQAETGLYPADLEDLMGWDAPQVGLTELGVEVPIHAQDFRGPYLIAPGEDLPIDRTTGRRDWDYSTRKPTVGAVHSLNANTSLDGVPYSTY